MMAEYNEKKRQLNTHIQTQRNAMLLRTKTTQQKVLFLLNKLNKYFDQNSFWQCKSFGQPNIFIRTNTGKQT